MNFLLQAGNVLQQEKSCILKYGSGKIEYVNINHELSLEKYKSYCPIGSVEFVQKFCKEQNLKYTAVPSYPNELTKFLGRELVVCKFAEAKDDWFIKPVELKKFNGGFKELLEEEISPSEICYSSPVVNFFAEWRFYILNKKILGHAWYAGEYATISDVQVEFVEQLIKNYSSAPIGYSIDIGLTKNGRTLLVEINDGWSLGYYNNGTISEKNYVKLIEERWKQITNHS